MENETQTAGTAPQNVVANAEEAEKLPPGQWAIDANGQGRCLVDTNVGWPQRMWMSDGGRSYTAIEGIDYPLTLADVDEVCPHSWGTQECGHCRHCGAVVEPPKDLEWNLTALVPRSTGAAAGPIHHSYEDGETE